MGATLTQHDFQAVSRLVHRVAGVNLTPGKEGLVESRLARRLRALGLPSFGDYLRHVEEDSGDELRMLVDLLTTNKTGFFREGDHFAHLRTHVLPRLAARGGDARFWSAGCSTGEEPYSLAMLLAEEGDAAPHPARILATDISTRVLAKARAAEYDAAMLQDLDRARVTRHFQPLDRPPSRYRVRPAVRELVHFARLNLVAPWPMRAPFDVILCRNVMIYFDAPTQERLVNRFWESLAPGGTLLVGHSESLTALSHRFTYVQPATYRR